MTHTPGESALFAQMNGLYRFSTRLPLVGLNQTTLDDIWEWCNENFGERGVHWDRMVTLEGWTYWFNDEQVTTMFLLRWT